MNEMTKQMVLGAVRSILMAGGGVLATKGFMESATVEQVVGAIVVLLGAAWTAWDHAQQEKKAQAREAQAVNVGIAVADRTVGVTPPVPPDKAPAVIEEFKSVVPAEVKKPEDRGTGLSVTADSPVVPAAPKQP